jgi:hypothetical protein
VRLNFYSNNIGCNVLGPKFKRIVGNDARRIIELTRHKIADDGFEVGLLNFGLAVDSAICAEAIYDKVDDLIGSTRARWSATSLSSAYVSPTQQ